ncbi:NAD(P)/FAD-dependent oxidoreductase [Arthrobacter sp. PAMC25564]|uniref:flavin-containing monooxygenase n=1 Tax=Arthrobacter sp. PAMC25564 TaxID=2565366 RepID=UPI0010A23D6B|nr:NAD(P)/FAD-dependent oxidoreductase [Arthrobacter sp. PAMC25564]QCB96534.1 NAD(P)/FAD-dependent oxidoreductase [Arthrobacter sp. PAMC25564]
MKNQTKTDGTTAGQTGDLVLDVLIVGAGFAGLYALHKVRDQMGLSARAFDVASDVGGTWYWNRYPGARCDIESIHYSYSFSDELQQEWEWSEKFAAQPEILRYLNHVSDRFDLRKDIQFNTRITSMVWDGQASQWNVGFADGSTVKASFIISGAGNLSVPKEPDFPGVEDFKGEVYLTGNWPHGTVDFTGKRVGIIGTGSTGIQAISEIAKDAAQLTVFQRTPNYATPIGNGPAVPAEVSDVKANYRSIRDACRNHFLGVPYTDVQPSALAVSTEERRQTFDNRWDRGGFRLFIDSYQDILVNKDANDTISEYIRERIHGRVKDPAVAELLAPKGYAYGTKRPPLETNYYEVYNQDNVTLVDVRTAPIARITGTGVVTASGEFEFDVLILATGFDAMTGPLLAMGIVGRNGLRLEDKWADGPHTYLGIAVNAFPNLFLITGPQSPSVLYNMPLAIEDHVDFATDAISYVRENGLHTIEPEQEAEEKWVAHANELAQATLLPGTDSWYMGANIPGKPRKCLVYLGGAPAYRKICADVVEGGYEGFVLETAPSLLEVS